MQFSLPVQARKSYNFQANKPHETARLLVAKFADKITQLIPQFIPESKPQNWILEPSSIKIREENGRTASIPVYNSLSLRNESLPSKEAALKTSAALKKLDNYLSKHVYNKDRASQSPNQGESELLSTPIHIQEIQPKADYLSKSIYGGLIGLMAGALFGLAVDKQSGKEYSKTKLKRYLPYKVAIEMPSLPWPPAAAHNCINRLHEVLDPAKSWLVTSIGASHPSIPILQQEIAKSGIKLNISTQKPLLSYPLPSHQDTVKKGILIVVEPGFNTRSALEQVQQLLNQVPETIDIRLIIIGTPIPADCVPSA